MEGKKVPERFLVKTGSKEKSEGEDTQKRRLLKTEQSRLKERKVGGSSFGDCQ